MDNSKCRAIEIFFRPALEDRRKNGQCVPILLIIDPSVNTLCQHQLFARSACLTLTFSISHGWPVHCSRFEVKEKREREREREG